MIIFKLPDLGEGLPEAEIREWYVKVGDEVVTDQPMVSVETAKALVDVPAPYDGVVEKLFGDEGDTIETDHPLIGFKGESAVEETTDAGTVVGQIEVASHATIPASDLNPSANNKNTVRATPAVRALARRLNVDLNTVQSSGPRISKEDVERAAQQQPGKTIPEDHTKMSASQQAMALTMQRAHSEVVPITVTDDVIIDAWFKQQDLTIRIIKAIADAVKVEPILNSHYDHQNASYRRFESVNLGIAVDSPHGLYVPVIPDIAHQDETALRDMIETYKEQAANKSIKQENLKDATLILSNFGSFAAKYATPVVTPPTVCIIGTGRVYQSVAVIEGAVKPVYTLPLSVSADHRLITGGQLTRFLAQLKASLHQA